MSSDIVLFLFLLIKKDGVFSSPLPHADTIIAI